MPKLVEIAPDIWLAEGSNVNFYGFAYPTRSVIVRLPDASLWVWSPIALTDGLRREIEAIGQPCHLVSPNRIHHLFLQDWKAAWPDALLWGPQSTIDKRADLRFQAALEDVAPPGWQGAFDLAWFRGSRFLDEIVFFHRPSRTAILADMSENFTEAFLNRHWSGWQRVIARLWGIVEGKGYAPLELRLSFIFRADLRKARDKVLAWNPERVIMAHGRWQDRDGRAFLERAFAWIG
ncbi:MAG: DUF4336 domain-containing protein [Jhaorihella sp.]